MYLSDDKIATLCGYKLYLDPNNNLFHRTHENAGLISPFKAYSETVNHTSVGLSSCGYDLSLGPQFKKIIGGDVDYSKPILDETYEEYGHQVVLSPNEFVLAHSVEYIRMPSYLVGFVLDKSSLARRGLSVQNTCIEPGWEGIITLELHNMSSRNITIVEGMGIAQLCFAVLETIPVLPYNIKNNGKPGKYQNQTGVQPAR